MAIGKTYVATRNGRVCNVVVRMPDGTERPLDWARGLIDHSEEFGWGYSGSAPAQLALAILADHLDARWHQDDHRPGSPTARAVGLHQEFKLRAIMPARYPGWQLTSRQIAEHVALIEWDRDRANLPVSPELPLGGDAA